MLKFIKVVKVKWSETITVNMVNALKCIAETNGPGLKD